MSKIRVIDGEVRSEHRRCNLAAVGAVADKGAAKARALSGE